MAQLAEEICGCKAELLTGGLSGANAATMVAHLWKGQPVLIPYPPPFWNTASANNRLRVGNFLTALTSYDEDFNHEPCQRSGHRAHWAVASGKI